MATRTKPTVAPASASRNEAVASLLRPRRKPLHVVAGAFLVVLLALAFMWLQLRADRAEEVLLVARPVPAGHVITSADLSVASVVPDPALRYVPAARTDVVVGRTAAVPLVRGALLSPDQIGPPAWPAAGEAVVALPFKAGRIPAGVTPGARVRVLPLDTGTSVPDGATRPVGVLATVVVVQSDVDSSGTVIVSLLLRSTDAAVAATGGESTLVLLGPAG